jgi:NDP-sugar pyrophosphorylase family protein
METGLVSGERHPGLWLDIGTPQRLLELDAWLRDQPGQAGIDESPGQALETSPLDQGLTPQPASPG